ncbi:hypothetical protein ACLOJK_027198 [Asimina triloba]
MLSLIKFPSLECPSASNPFRTFGGAPPTILIRRPKNYFIPCERAHHHRFKVRWNIEWKRRGEWRARCQDWSCGIPPPDATPSVDEVVNNFYATVNEKDKKKLEEIICDDCHFEEFIFYLPFDTKEVVCLS